jgi:hypothetical protein
MNIPAILEKIFPQDIAEYIYWDFTYPISRQVVIDRKARVCIQIKFNKVLEELKNWFE